MAKIILVIEDKPENRVAVVATPSAMEIVQRVRGMAATMTSAEAYALLAMRTIVEASKAQRQEGLIIRLPGITS